MAIKIAWPSRPRADRTQSSAGQESETDMRLRRRGLVRVQGRRHGPAVTCLEGTVWITQAGDPRDHVLYAGDRFAVNRRGNVLVEAVRDARVKVTN